MGHVRFSPKTITVYFENKKRFDYKNNHGCSKSANFYLDNISKINYRMLVILSYTLSKLRLKKIQLNRRVFQ